MGSSESLKVLPSRDDGVAGVGPAVVADDEVVLVAEQIDDLALGLVAPLQADHARAGHCRTCPGATRGVKRTASRQQKRPGHAPGRVGP